jgi:hypothetical protein
MRWNQAWSSTFLNASRWSFRILPRYRLCRHFSSHFRHSSNRRETVVHQRMFVKSTRHTRHTGGTTRAECKREAWSTCVDSSKAKVGVGIVQRTVRAVENLLGLRHGLLEVLPPGRQPFAEHLGRLTVVVLF